jgi:putative peptide zinc metalloprotease protein
MSEETKKIVLPAYLTRRFEAFRVVKDGVTTYLIRDKIQGKVHDFDAWQFFILESLSGCETLDKLQVMFRDRFDRDLTQRDLDEFLGSLADRKLLEESAAKHPLLAPFMQRTFDVEDGKAVPRPAAPGPAAPAPRDKDLPPGVQDALGLDWRTSENMIGLFNPRPLMLFLRPLTRPLRHAVYLVPLLLLAALFAIYENAHLVAGDLSALRFDLSLVEYLLLMFVTVHVVTNTTSALVADAYKVAVDQVGLKLTFGFIPRWVLKMTGAERLTRVQTMWLHGSSLLARAVVFSIGTLLWFNTRGDQNRLSEFGLVLMFGSAAGFLLESGNPLVKSHGYYLLSAYLNEAHLRGKAYASLLNKLRGGVYRAADSTLLSLYAFLASTYVLIVILIVGWMIAKFVLGDLRLGGSAILLTLGFVGFMVWRNYAGLKSFGETYEKQMQFDRWRNRTLPVGAVEGEIKVEKKSYWGRAILVGVLLAMFIPYPYDAGGSFLTYPARRQVLSTDQPGLVEAVFFNGGEAVKQGVPIARLSHADYLADIKVISAKIDEQQAVVRNLRTLPRPEDVREAQKVLEVERTRERFSREKVPRLEKLQRIGAVSLEELAAARKENDTDRAQVAQREAELARVKAPVTADQIAGAEAKLASLIEERTRIEDKLTRTELLMPFDGNLLTLHLKDKINTYLEKGAPLAVVEDTAHVTIEIGVPESDIRYVKLGSKVRARAVSFFDDREFEGAVTLIDRNVTSQPTGNVIKVIATIDNPDGLLRTGMEGRAKIEGVQMPLWKAYSLGIMRFIQIQVWSWLP